MEKEINLRLLFVILSGFTLLSGCIYKRDVSSRASKFTDYVVGQTYELKRHVFLHKYDRGDKHEIPTLNIIGTSGTSANVETFAFDNSANQQVVGLVRSGQKLTVFRIVENNAPNMGPFLHVYAKIIGGAFDNQTVDLIMISKDDLPRNRILIDPQNIGVSIP